VSYPLSRHEDRHRTVELELHHFSRCRVGMPPEVADQTAGGASLTSSGAVADPRGTLDVLIRAHVVHQRDEPVVQHRKISTEDLLGGRIRWPFCLCHQFFTRLLDVQVAHKPRVLFDKRPTRLRIVAHQAFE